MGKRPPCVLGSIARCRVGESRARLRFPTNGATLLGLGPNEGKYIFLTTWFIDNLIFCVISKVLILIAISLLATSQRLETHATY